MTWVHLTSPTTSVLLGTVPRADRTQEEASTDEIAVVAHWGAPLPVEVDGSDLLRATTRAVPHSAPDVPLRQAALPQPVDGWRLRPALTGSAADGTRFAPRLSVTDLRQAGNTATLVLDDEAIGLHVETTYVLDEHGILRVSHQLTNTGPAPWLLAGLATALPLPDRATEVLDLTGRWSGERKAQRHDLPYGSWVRETRHGRTGHDAPLVVHVGAPGFGFGHGEVWAVHHAWSGDSVVFAERDPSGFVQVGCAEALAPGEVVLQSGETHTTPTTYAAYTADGGLDAISGAFHDHLRARPSHPRSPRKVLLNTWEAAYFEHDLTRMQQLADVAAAVGVERFVLDDGWFGDRRHDRAGLGDWTVSPEVWPQGLGPLIEHVRAVGMDFGIWVEPEMVNADSDVLRAHPDWVLAVPGRTPLPWRHQQVLDLVRPEAYAHVFGQLDALLRDHDIAYVKWDMNRDLIDVAHDARPAVHAQTEAVYRLLDDLRASHPGVEFESCASGGGRVDLGILARTDRIWPSDTIDAHERVGIHRWTGSLVPPELMGAHIGSAVAHTTGRRLTVGYRVASAIFGHLGVEADLTAISAEDLAVVTAGVAHYRRLRDLLHSGRVVRLDNLDPALAGHGVVSPDRRDGVFAIHQTEAGMAEVPGTVRLRGLDPLARYAVRTVDLGEVPQTQQIRPPAWLEAVMAGEDVVLSGALLTQVGLALPILRPDQALLLELHAR